MTRSEIFLFLFLATLFSLSLACDSDDDDDDDDDDADNDDQEPSDPWRWDLNDAGVLEIYYEDRLLYSLTQVQAVEFVPDVSMIFGVFTFKKSDETVRPFSFSEQDGRIFLQTDGQSAGRIIFATTANGNLRVRTELDPPFNRMALRFRFALADDDRFWGFGEQYAYVEFRGLAVPVWVQEQGLGRSQDPLLPFQGSLTNTYFPMPYFLDPGNGKGFLLENTEYSHFDLGQTDPAGWTVEVWNESTASFLLFPGPEPVQIVAQLTSELGRPKTAPPDWAFDGLWLAAQGGADSVRERLAIAIEAGIPVSAVWVQDWLGLRNFGLDNYGVKYRWINDPELYPNLAGFIDELNRQDVRFLGYFNPFIVPDYEHYDEAVQKNYIIRRPDGDPYLFLISTFLGSLVDVSNPEACEWFKGYARTAVDLGISGWMADFGEWLPYDAVIQGGVAPVLHNLYPTTWHRINREVLDEKYPDGDYVMITRSGYTGEQEVAQIVWGGDQEADWSETDGLPTVVTAGLTMSLSGILVYSHDIGGFSGGPREKELLLRWVELGGFTPVMRNHDGLQKLTNHHFDSDMETLEHFAKFAGYHAALLAYWKELARQTVTEGLPMIRHTILVDPQWELAFSAHRQWLLGEDLLIAPVVKQGQNEIEAFLPQGDWEHLFTGERYHGRSKVTVNAQIGTPAVFVRQGRLQEMVDEIREIYKR